MRRTTVAVMVWTAAWCLACAECTAPTGPPAESFVPVPVDKSAVLALEGSGVTVSEQTLESRLIQTTGNPLVDWPVSAVADRVDRVEVRRDGTLEQTNFYWRNGRFIAGIAKSNDAWIGYQLLELEHLGRAPVVTVARATSDGEGRPEGWTKVPVQESFDLRTLVQDGADGAVAGEALQWVGDEAWPWVEDRFRASADDRKRADAALEVCTTRQAATRCDEISDGSTLCTGPDQFFVKAPWLPAPVTNHHAELDARITEALQQEPGPWAAHAALTCASTAGLDDEAARPLIAAMARGVCEDASPTDHIAHLSAWSASTLRASLADAALETPCTSEDRADLVRLAVGRPVAHERLIALLSSSDPAVRTALLDHIRANPTGNRTMVYRALKDQHLSAEEATDLLGEHTPRGDEVIILAEAYTRRPALQARARILRAFDEMPASEPAIPAALQTVRTALDAAGEEGRPSLHAALAVLGVTDHQLPTARAVGDLLIPPSAPEFVGSESELLAYALVLAGCDSFSLDEITARAREAAPTDRGAVCE